MKVIDFLGPATGLTDGASHALNRKFDQLIDGLVHQSDLLKLKAKRVVRTVLRQVPGTRKAPGRTLRHAMQQMPLMRAERTYNTSHPDYDRYLVRNFPGRIFNHNLPCDNLPFGPSLG